MAGKSDETSVEVIVKVLPNLASTNDARESLRACTQTMGIALSPIDADTSSGSELAKFYVARVASDDASRIVARLRECAGVEAAYTKPRGEPPNGRM